MSLNSRVPEDRSPSRRPKAAAVAAAALSAGLVVAGLATVPATVASAAEETAAEEKPPPSLVGPVTRAEVEAAEPAWVAAEIDAAPDADAARALTEVEPGAEVVVYLGTWCSDSRRELSRLWRAFDEAGVGYGAELPFALEYVAVDRDKQEPGGRTAGVGIEYVPTFVVRRDGEEVGRMVEVSPHGIEHDLLALLTGAARGVVSAREDLGTGAERPVQP
jgi:hypothetical protein